MHVKHVLIPAELTVHRGGYYIKSPRICQDLFYFSAACARAVSGVALPSKEDNQTTLQIKRALADIGVQLVDQVIVADGDFVCLRDNGLLD